MTSPISVMLWVVLLSVRMHIIDPSSSTFIHAVQIPPQPLTLRLAVFDWLGIDGTSYLWDASTPGGRAVTVSFLIGAKLFNERRSDIIPSLDALKSCNKQIRITQICDDGGSPLRAANDAQWIINEIGADGFLGFGGIESSFTGSMVGKVHNIPTIDHWTTSPRTTFRRDFPWYARTIPSDQSYAIMIANLVEQLGFKHIVVLYLSDGVDFMAYLATLLQQKSITFTAVKFEYGQNNNNIRDKVAYIKALSLNVIVCATWTAQLPDIANAAVEYDLVGPDMQWIFSYMTRGPFANEFAYYPNLTTLFHGALWPHASTGTANSNLENVQNMWYTLDGDIPDFNTYLPPHGMMNSINECKNSQLHASLEYDFFSATAVERVYAWDIIGYAIDAVLSYGFAICHDNDLGPIPTGEALWQKLINTSFVGVSGSFLKFDPTTGDRDPASAGFVLTNWNDIHPQDIGTFNSETNTFDIQLDRIVFKQGIGMQYKPRDITPPYHEENLLPIWAKFVGLVEFGILIFISISIASFLFSQQHQKIIINNQPVLLHVVNLGCFISSWTILSLSFSEDDGTRLSSHSDGACTSSPILFACGMSLVASALNAKAFRIWQMFHIHDFRLAKKKASLRGSLLQVGLLQIMLWVVCITWIVIAPLTYERIITASDINGFPTQSFALCTGTIVSVLFLVIVFVIFFGSFVVSALAAYRIQTIPSEFQEGRYILSALMSSTQLYSIALPAVIAVYNDTLPRYMILTQVVFLSVLLVHVFVFFPKVSVVYLGKDLLKEPSSSGNGRTKVEPLMEVFDQGDVASDLNGGVITVLTAKTVYMSTQHVMVPQGSKFWQQKVLVRLVNTSWIRRSFSVGWSAMLTVMVALIMVGMVPNALGYVFSVGVGLGSCVVLFTAMSFPLLKQLVYEETSGYASIVFITIILNGILLGIALNDQRASVVPGLLSMQLIAFLTDALVIPNLRSLLILNSLVPTAIVVILVVFNIVPALNNVVLPIGQSGYSLLQMLRDSEIAQVVHLLVELNLIWRGKDRKRFIHLKDPVELRIVTFAESAENELQKSRHGRFEGNVSSIVIRSGFVARQESVTGVQSQMDDGSHATSGNNTQNTPRAKTRIFVNKVAVKQRDSFAVRVCGYRLGQHLFIILESHVGNVLLLVAIIGAMTLTIAVGVTSNSFLALGIIPCLVLLMMCEIAVLSRRLVVLLCKRVAFIAELLFMLTWLALAIYVMSDERIVIVLFGFVDHLLGLVADADTRMRPTTRLGRLLRVWRGKGVMFAFSLFLLFDLLPLGRYSVLEISTGEATSNVAMSQRVDAIDLAQQCGDWGLFYLSLPSVLAGIRIILWDTRGSASMQYFAMIQAPIAPVYEGDDIQNTVMVESMVRKSPRHRGNDDGGHQPMEEESRQKNEEAAFSRTELNEMLIDSLVKEGLQHGRAASAVAEEEFEVVT